ncbi:MAG: hypothetical protein ACI88A_000973 [Paraglaciecola sp.]
MKEHGRFIVAQAGQLLLFAGEGPWNDDTLRRGSREMGAVIRAIDKTKPWAQLSLLYGDSLMIPSAFKNFIKGTSERKVLGLSALAIVIKDSAITSLIKNQLREAYQQPEIEHAFFDCNEDALLWLKEQAFEITEKEIVAFLSRCDFAR